MAIYTADMEQLRAKLFRNGGSQAVRLPREFRFPGDRVYLKRVGNAVVLLPYAAPWQSLVDSLSLFSGSISQSGRRIWGSHILRSPIAVFTGMGFVSMNIAFTRSSIP